MYSTGKGNTVLTDIILAQALTPLCPSKSQRQDPALSYPEGNRDQVGQRQC